MTKRYTLNVSKDVYLKLLDLGVEERRRTDNNPTTDDLLRKILKLPPRNKNRKSQGNTP